MTCWSCSFSACRAVCSLRPSPSFVVCMRVFGGARYGHVTLFAAAFPLAAVCAMLNNVMEIRSDAYKVCSVQRPIPHRCASIGSWLTAFEALGCVHGCGCGCGCEAVAVVVPVAVAVKL